MKAGLAMAVIVTILGGVSVLIGVAGVASPRVIVALVRHWQGPARFRLAVVARLVLGAWLLAVAPDCRAPIVIRTVGVIAIVAAIGILLAGQRRLDALIEWWTGRPTLLRLSATVAIGFGALLIAAGP